MALVSGGRSTLNPNAPLFVPAALRHVEDFSPEWWQLVTTSTWYRDYWLSQHPEGFFDHAEDDLDCDDVVDLLPDSIDFSNGDDFSSMEAQYEEFIQFTEAEGNKFSSLGMNGKGIIVEFISLSAFSDFKNMWEFRNDDSREAA